MEDTAKPGDETKIESEKENIDTSQEKIESSEQKKIKERFRHRYHIQENCKF